MLHVEQKSFKNTAIDSQVTQHRVQSFTELTNHDESVAQNFFTVTTVTKTCQELPKTRLEPITFAINLRLSTFTLTVFYYIKSLLSVT